MESQGAAFLTLSVIARSSMEHGRCIDCAEAIGPSGIAGGRIDSLNLVGRKLRNDWAVGGRQIS
jgi:hypothetical protein